MSSKAGGLDRSPISSTAWKVESLPGPARLIPSVVPLGVRAFAPVPIPSAVADAYTANLHAGCCNTGQHLAGLSCAYKM
jgi:hypothetical protein